MGLTFLRQQFDEEPAQEDRLLCETPETRFRARRVIPSCAVCSVDGLQNGSQSAGHFRALRQLEPDFCLPNFCLRPAQPLTHGGGPHKEGRCDPLRGKTEHRLQHERCVDAFVDGRMRA